MPRFENQLYFASVNTPAGRIPRRYRLTRALVFHSDILSRIQVANGFDTDLATIPRPFTALWPPDGDYAEAAVVHDWVLKMGFRSRIAAEIFVEALDALGIKGGKRWCLATAVRLFARLSRY